MNTINQPPSLTQVNQALQHFTNRHELIKRFAEYLNDDPPKNQILFFYGDGGNGKSLLLKFLFKNVCQRFSTEYWQDIKTQSFEKINYISNNFNSPESNHLHFLKKWLELIKKLFGGQKNKLFKKLPAVFVDFAQESIEHESPQDVFDGLLILRKKLVSTAVELEYKIDFPLYEFACLWYLKQKGKLTNEYISKYFPAAELYLTGGIINIVKVFGEQFTKLGSTLAVLTIPATLVILVGGILNIIAKYLGKDLTLYLRGRGLKAEDLQKIIQLDPEQELLEALPNFFVEDLNVFMEKDNAPERLVLFFDSHETFWGDWRERGEARFFKQDEWLRCLLAQLNLSRGIVVVVAGREIPRWHLATHWPIQKTKLECIPVLNFTNINALQYLKQVGIQETMLCHHLIDYAQLEEDSVYPLLLGLCADIARVTQTEGKSFNYEDFCLTEKIEIKLKSSVERLLKYVDEEIRDAVDAMSACRTFDLTLYFNLGQSLQFNSTSASFRILTGFSFVWPAEQQGENWYRLHPLIRRFTLEQNRNITQSAHQFLEQYYREQGNLPEAIYHLIYQDWDVGVKEWLKSFKNAIQEENFELCRNLEIIRKEISF